MKIQILMLLAIASMAPLASTDTPAQIYCGRRLATTIAIICDSIPGKRSGSYNSLDYEYNWPWVAPNKARALGRGKRDQGIVQECCDKPCTLDEMMEYC